MTCIREYLRSPLLALVIFVSLTAAASAAQSPARPIAVTLSPASASIHWTLNTNIHTVHGTFKLKSGDLKIDPATGNASGLIVIDATSGESGDSSRDNRMHNVIIESPKYPTITFRPVRIDGKIDLTTTGHVTVHGILNLHGQDHPLDLIMNLHPQGNSVALATHFSVPFVAWGLKDPSTFVFRTDKQVVLDVDGAVTPFFDPARPR